MFIPTNRELPEWTSDDALSLKSFLESSTGVKLAQTLSFLAPTLLDGEHKNKTLVASGTVKGYTDAIENLFALQTSRPKEAEPKSDNYPSLDDDSKWTEQNEPPTPKR
jgi:hypothetical protein